MGNRVTLKIINKTGQDLTCSDVRCGSFSDLSYGTVVKNGATGQFNSSTNDRLFCTWEVKGGIAAFQMGMTCPKSSHNSAFGSAKAGLQHYSQTGTPATFTYNVGQPNMADWNHGDEDKGDVIAYGDCS